MDGNGNMRDREVVEWTKGKSDEDMTGIEEHLQSYCNENSLIWVSLLPGVIGYHPMRVKGAGSTKRVSDSL